MRFPLATRYADYDTKGHVNNATYLTYFEIARERAWTDVLGQPPEPDFVVAEARVRYASPAMLGEPLDMELATTEVRTKAWVWSYRITSGDRLVAEGRTTQVMYDYVERRSIPIRDSVRDRLASV